MAWIQGLSACVIIGLMTDSSYSRPALRLMLLISLLQGLTLFLLWRATDNQLWPSQTPLVNFPLWTVAVALPVLLLLGMEAGKERQAVWRVSLFVALLALLGVYIGWQLTPFGQFPTDPITGSYAFSLALACFLALLFLRPLVRRQTPDYAEIFADSWRNALVLALAWSLTLGVAGIMMLWGELFRVIGIDFFSELFSEDWFLVPVLSVVFGLGIFIFRGMATVIAGITSLLQGLNWLLLPLVLTIIVLFLAVLPMTGLTPLWGTGHGTVMLMVLNLQALFALNAVYQLGDHAAGPPLLHRLIGIGTVLLPLIALLALYGLYLRIDQYGWTVARGWALIIGLLIALFSCGYAANVLRFRDGWTARLSRVNLPMSLLILALILLLNSPLLDLRKISLASQQARVEQGEISLEEFDFFYAREYLGRSAWLWMQQLIEVNRESDPELAQLVREPVRRADTPLLFGSATREDIDFRSRVSYRPEPFPIPEALHQAMQFSTVAAMVNTGDIDDLILIQADLDGDQQAEYILAGAWLDTVAASGFYLDNGSWQELQTSPVQQRDPEVEQTLQDGSIRVVQPPFSHLQIGDLTLRFFKP